MVAFLDVEGFLCQRKLSHCEPTLLSTGEGGQRVRQVQAEGSGEEALAFSSQLGQIVA